MVTPDNDDKTKRKRTSIALLGLLPGLALAVVFGTPMTTTAPAFIPGLWLRDWGVLGGLEWIVGLVALTIVGLAVTERYHSKKAVLNGLLVCALLSLGLSSTKNIRPAFGPDWRLDSELRHYKHAVASSGRFGDQFTETHGSRTLHYWRWMSWGIDSAVGVIYDSSDKLHDDEKGLFRVESSGGNIWKLRKIEPHWYFVEYN